MNAAFDHREEEMRVLREEKKVLLIVNGSVSDKRLNNEITF